MIFFDIQINWQWQTSDRAIILPLASSLIAFTIYWFTAESKKIKESFYARHSFDEASYRHIFFTKIFGFVVMGILPFLLCFPLLDLPWEAYGLTFRQDTFLFSLLWTLGICALVIPVGYLNGRKPKNLVNYPQIRAKVWTKKIYVINLLGWFLYLLGYEFMFRGVLLAPMIPVLGIWPATMINVALYSATHIPKGMDETIGAIPLGLVLCILTAMSGTIWIAFFVHLAMSWTNSLTALKFHPEIKYYKNIR